MAWNSLIGQCLPSKPDGRRGGRRGNSSAADSENSRIGPQNMPQLRSAMHWWKPWQAPCLAACAARCLRALSSTGRASIPQSASASRTRCDPAVHRSQPRAWVRRELARIQTDRASKNSPVNHAPCKGLQGDGRGYEIGLDLLK